MFNIPLNKIPEKLEELKTNGLKNFIPGDIDLAAIDKYNQSLQEDLDAQTAMAKACQNTNAQTRALIQSANGATIAAKQLTLATKAKTAAMKAASAAANILVTSLIAFGISKAFQWIDDMVHKVEHAKESLNETASEIKDLSDTFGSTQKTVKATSQRFAELSQGVNQLTGENLTLDTGEYEEFLDLSNQLADLLPSLPRVYDENGNAIAQLSGDVDTIVGSLQNLVQAEKDLTNLEIANKLPDLYKNAKETASDYKRQYNIAKTDYEYRQNLINGLQAFDFSVLGTDDDGDGMVAVNADKEYMSAYANLFSRLGVGFTYDNVYQDMNGNFIYEGLQVQLSELESVKKDIPLVINELLTTYNTGLSNLASEMKTFSGYYESTWNSINPALAAWLYTTPDYSEFDTNLQTGIQTSLDAIDWGKLNLSSDEEMKDYITKCFIEPIRDNTEVRDAFLQLFALEPGTLERVDIAQDLQSMLDAMNLSYEVDIMALVANEKEVKHDLTNSLQEIVLGHSAVFDRGKSDEIALSNSDDYAYLLSYTKDFTVEEAKAWLAVYDSAKSAGENIAIYEQYLADLNKKNVVPKTIPTISETVTAINTRLKPSLESLQSLYQSVFTDNGLDLANVNTAVLSSMMEELDEIGVATADYESFISVITNSHSSAEDVQQAFDALATSILQTANVADITEENYGLLVQQLKNLGITNAEEILSKLYTAQKELTSLGFDFANAELESAKAISAMEKCSDEARQYLINYMLTKQIAEQPLNTTQDVEALEDLCKSLSASGELLAEVAKLKSLLSIADTDYGRNSVYINGEIEKTRVRILEMTSTNYTLGFDFDFNGNKVSRAVSSATTDYAALLDKETSLLEKQLDAGLITFSDYLDKRSALLEDYYASGRITAEDYYDRLSSLYESQLSAYDKVVNTVTNRIDREIDTLEKQKKVVEESYQFKIDAVQAEIDALNKANEARKEQIALEQAQYEAERARSQRSVKQFVNGQFVYTADYEEVKSAEENLAEQKQQMEISRLEDQIASLEQEMENATASLDNQIYALEAYKEQWNEIGSVYEEQQNALIAAEILGADWEAQVLNQRLDTLQEFTSRYIALQQAQADAAAHTTSVKQSIEGFDAPSDHLTPAAPALLQQGELTLTSSQQDNLAAALLRNSVDYGGLAMQDYATGRFDFSKLPGSTQSVVQNINLTLPNITNRTGYENLQKELHQMQIDARQLAYRH